MSDRTQLALGRNTISVPRMTKRIIETIIGTALSCLVALIILVLNNVLTGRGGWLNGFDVWLNFVSRPDILGTMILTSLVTVLYIAWQRDQNGVKR